MTRFPDHFSAVAHAYAAFRPQYPEALFAYLATLPARRGLAWDCGAGSGQASMALARHFDRVVASDASVAQLTAASRDHHGVWYCAALAEASALATGSADLVTVAQALHWFDPVAFYAEAKRVLAPGGVVGVWTYGRSELDRAPLDAALRVFYDEIVGPYWPPERRHVESGYRDVVFPFDELAPPAFTMEVRWTLPQLVAYVGTWSAVARFRSARGDDPLPALDRTLRPFWGDAGVARRVRWPLRLRVGRAPL